MERIHVVLLLIVIGLGCSEADPGERIAGVDGSSLMLEARIDTLETINAQLIEEASLQRAFLETYTQLINQTLVDLDAIAAREGIMRRIRVDLDAGEQHGGSVETIEERIQESLAAIEAYIRESKQQRKALVNQRAELKRLAERPQIDVTGLENTIRRLNDLVAEKERNILALREEAMLMLKRIATLKHANTTLHAENTTLKQAFVVIGTHDELQQKNIIDRSGGFLSIGRKTRIDELDPRHFEQVDVATAEVFVGKNLSRYQVLSSQKLQDHLFTFEERGGSVYLKTSNPSEFWNISRYLIIEVKR